MEIKFLGTGGAFLPHKGNAAAILQLNGKSILIDCGFATFQKLLDLDLIPTLDYILLTHLHADHVGSLGTLLAYGEVRCEKRIPILYPTEAFRGDIHTFLELTFEAKRADYLPLSEVPEIGYIDTYGKHVPEGQSFAYYISDGETLLYYSGDLGDVTITVDFLKSRYERDITVFHDVSPIDKPAHVYYKTAMETLSDYKVYGYHCAKEAMPADNTVALVEDHPEFLI